MVREGLIVLTAMAAAITVLAAVWGFPHIPPVTMQEVATKAPLEFTRQTLANFTGTAGLQHYGPPFTDNFENAQRVGPFCPACWAGITEPLDFRQAMVMTPLRQAGIVNPSIASSLERYRQATPGQQKAWTDAYGIALGNATTQNGRIDLPAGDYGPVPDLMDAMLKLAQAGLLEGALNQGMHPEYAPYNTDYTLSLFYMGGLYDKIAAHFDEQGGQWGLSHMAGPYPGAWWLWPYAFVYQIPMVANSPNADLIAGMIIAAVVLILFFLPFIPGLNRLPYLIPVHRMIWRDWYRSHPSGDPTRHRKDEPG
jgi:hypothetical protein